MDIFSYFHISNLPQRDASRGHRGSRSTSADHNGNLPLMNAFTAATDYWIDAVQRSLMFHKSLLLSTVGEIL